MQFCASTGKVYIDDPDVANASKDNISVTRLGFQPERKILSTLLCEKSGKLNKIEVTSEGAFGS